MAVASPSRSNCGRCGCKLNVSTPCSRPSRSSAVSTSIGEGDPIRFGCRVKSEAILDRRAKAGEERAREAAELLLRRDRLVPVVEEVRHLPLQALVMGKIRHIANVMVWADENEIVRLREKLPDSLDLGTRRNLAGPERVEADDDERVGAIENSVERRDIAVIRHALDLHHRLAGQRLSLFDEGSEVALHDVVEEASNALIEPEGV